jgi:ERCC4-type nuclease
MAKKRKPKPTLIIDSREQEPWCFDDDEAFEGTEVGGLKTGDYSIKGMEDIITVERKATADELFSNFCNKTNAGREFRKIERMRSYPLAYFVIEQDIDQVRSPSSYYVVKKKKKPPHVPWRLARSKTYEVYFAACVRNAP